MDDTLVNLQSNKYENIEEVTGKEGFFKNLEPLPFLDEINKLAALCPENIFIISACVETVYCVPEKISWLKKYLPNASKENVIFTRLGEDKARIAREKLNHGLTKYDLLIDDYSENLKKWKAAGGTAIKFKNSFNTANPEKYKYIISNFSELGEILGKIREEFEV